MKKIQCISTLIFLLFSYESLSCSCVELRPNDYLDNCKSIYSATLLEANLTSTTDKPEIEGRISKPIEVFKGEQSAVNIYAVKSSGTCYTNILVGEDYLVCEINQEKIYVSQCTYTKPMIWGITDELVKGIKDVENK